MAFIFPTGVTTGEGHYGIIVVGDANMINCNSLSFNLLILLTTNKGLMLQTPPTVVL